MVTTRADQEQGVTHPMITTRTLLARADIDCSNIADLIADIEVPVLSGPQRQGDIGVFPRGPLTPADRDAADPVTGGGVNLVTGEATGNAHVLMADGPVLFLRRDTDLLIGLVEIGDGGVAHVIHTDEHAAISVGPGCYEIRGKREQAAEIRRVAD